MVITFRRLILFYLLFLMLGIAAIILVRMIVLLGKIVFIAVIAHFQIRKEEVEETSTAESSEDGANHFVIDIHGDDSVNYNEDGQFGYGPETDPSAMTPMSVSTLRSNGTGHAVPPLPCPESLKSIEISSKVTQSASPNDGALLHPTFASEVTDADVDYIPGRPISDLVQTDNFNNGGDYIINIQQSHMSDYAEAYVFTTISVYLADLLPLIADPENGETSTLTPASEVPELEGDCPSGILRLQQQCSLTKATDHAPNLPSCIDM
ncbi:hypothetical protein R1flu_018708 [Riccia fluitans]|uniref:Uncharacterized protein n=1 Tax=Riccia fluitans TaxID=41844 RepID=A0ABD1ZGM0_9MARC